MVKDLIKNERNAELLSLLRKHDLLSYKHSVRVAEIAEKRIDDYSFGEINKESIIEGALLHDVGKLYIPTSILQKNGSLTPKEMDIVKLHSALGLTLLADRDEVIKNICLYHHEKLNGSGYPLGFSGERIPEYCKFITAIDISEALSSKRPYKDAMAYPEIKKEIAKMSSRGEVDLKYFNGMKSLLSKQDPIALNIGDYIKVKGETALC